MASQALRTIRSRAYKSAGPAAVVFVCGIALGWRRVVAERESFDGKGYKATQ